MHLVQLNDRLHWTETSWLQSNRMVNRFTSTKYSGYDHLDCLIYTPSRGCAAPYNVRWKKVVSELEQVYGCQWIITVLWFCFVLLLCLLFVFVLCLVLNRCQCLWIVHAWLSLRFSLSFKYKRLPVMISFNCTERWKTVNCC